MGRGADRLVAAGFFALLAALVLITPTGADSAAGRAIALLCAAGQAAAILAMRRSPELGMALAVAAGIGLEVLTPDIGWLGQVAAILAGYARIRPPARSLVLLGLLVAATPVKLLHGDWSAVLLAAAGPALGWTLGELGRTRQLRREDQQRRVLAQERQRIALELHDILAHTVSVILVQAGAAADVFDNRPDLARQALSSIDRAARSTLSELRVLLQTLNPEQEPAGGPPQPGLDQLGTLAASMRAIGLRVDLDQPTAPGRLPPAVDLSAYRIVQESLTNTLRHSEAGHAQVSVRHEAATIHLEITDPGPARPAPREPTSGRGIIGMHERARLLGGTLFAGPDPAGGFQVRATLPAPAPAPTPLSETPPATPSGATPSAATPPLVTPPAADPLPDRPHPSTVKPPGVTAPPSIPPGAMPPAATP